MYTIKHPYYKGCFILCSILFFLRSLTAGFQPHILHSFGSRLFASHSTKILYLQFGVLFTGIYSPTISSKAVKHFAQIKYVLPVSELKKRSLFPVSPQTQQVNLTPMLKTFLIKCASALSTATVAFVQFLCTPTISRVIATTFIAVRNNNCIYKIFCANI